MGGMKWGGRIGVDWVYGLGLENCWEERIVSNGTMGMGREGGGLRYRESCNGIKGGHEEMVTVDWVWEYEGCENRGGF